MIYKIRQLQYFEQEKDLSKRIEIVQQLERDLFKAIRKKSRVVPILSTLYSQICV